MKKLAILWLLMFGANNSICSDNELSNGSIKQNEDAGAKAKFKEYNVQVYTKDGSNNKKAIDETKYEVKPYQYGFYVEFKDEAKCVELEVKGTTLWNKGSCADEVKTIYFDETLSIAIIVLENGKLIGYGLSDTESSLIAEKDPVLSETYLEIILNGGSNQKATENHYKKVDYGYGTDYILKHDVNCVEVKHKNNSLWKKGDQKVNEYPIKITINSFNGFIFIIFKTLYLSYKFDYGWTFVTKSDFEPLEYSKFKFVTVDSNGGNSSEKDDRFTKTGNDDLTLKTNDGFKFEEIKYDDNSVWKHAEDTSSKNRPDKIVLKLKSRCVWVYFSFIDFWVYKYINKDWKLVWSIEKGQQ
ncbi:conserved hypothetical protein [Theileria orientalis strain Shintoku]|uniref:SfiI-subtelomeric related protein family member n=1 Tax=Theileria orientalis strain Shintoku TaxID=869250 RepID=J4C460_THEOR|nr:conserved hypothetical protein [Theileria orientalis strain Shintoku]BAM41621.1 conserved hypothetical protein [Theileria orientalis strain Shintoku]|eukprot:XP_009691922.1 conserved hypothetical protein [Theileria orientalis strain Shintoku]